MKIKFIIIEYFYENESETEDLKQIKLKPTDPKVANRIFLNAEDIVLILLARDRFIDYDNISYWSEEKKSYLFLQKQTKF